MATKKEIATIIDRIRELYGERFTFNAAVMEAWQRAFEMVAFRFLEDALQKHMEESSKIPHLADIREAALKLAGGRFQGARQHTAPEGLIERVQSQNERAGLVKVSDADEYGRPIYSWARNEAAQ